MTIFKGALGPIAPRTVREHQVLHIAAELPQIDNVLDSARSLSISFPLHTVDVWSPRVMQGFRLFSGAGSSGGWNEWDRRLGGRDQG